MSTVDKSAGGEPSSSKRRLRRDGPRNDTSGRLALFLLSDSKAKSKYPTRFIPDAHGFSALTKSEIKRDSKEVELRSHFMQSVEESDSDDDMENLPMRSTKPPCSFDSTVHNKRKRINMWASNPALMERDLEQLRIAITNAKKALSDLSEEEERWLASFESVRMKLCDLGLESQATNKRLRRDYEALLEIAAKECGHTPGAKKMTEKDLLDELGERKFKLDQLLAQYESLAGTKSGVGLIDVEVDELDYPCDAPPFSVTRAYLRDGDETETDNGNGSPLSKAFTQLQELIKHYEASASDLEPFFLSDDQCESLYPDLSSKTSLTPALAFQANWNAYPSPATEKALCEHLLHLKDETSWVEYIQNLLSHHAALTKRKRRGPGTVQLSANVNSRTPRGLKLLVSPVSQFEDRYLAYIQSKDGCPEIRAPVLQNFQIPSDVGLTTIKAEDDTMRRCYLQSVAARTDSKTKRLKASIVDWRKISGESKENFLKTEMLYKIALRDEIQESIRMKQELISHNILTAADDEELQQFMAFQNSSAFNDSFSFSHAPSSFSSKSGARSSANRNNKRSGKANLNIKNSAASFNVDSNVLSLLSSSLNPSMVSAFNSLFGIEKSASAASANSAAAVNSGTAASAAAASSSATSSAAVAAAAAAGSSSATASASTNSASEQADGTDAEKNGDSPAVTPASSAANSAASAGGNKDSQDHDSPSDVGESKEILEYDHTASSFYETPELSDNSNPPFASSAAAAAAATAAAAAAVASHSSSSSSHSSGGSSKRRKSGGR